MVVSAGIEGSLLWWKNFEDSPMSKRSHQGEILDLVYDGCFNQVISTSADRLVRIS